MYKHTKHLKAQYGKRRKKATNHKDLHGIHARNTDTIELLQDNHRVRKVHLAL